MDAGSVNNVASAIANTYGTKETKQADDAKKSNVAGKTIGEPQLSEKAKSYYDELKTKYKDLDFILVSKDMKETAKANAAKYANPNKMVVLIDEEKVERMAEDEKFRKQYEGLIESAKKGIPQLKEAFGNSSDVKGYGMQVNDNGTASFFAVMKKSSDEATAKLEKKREAKKAEKKAAQKKADKKEREEKLKEQRAKKAEKSEQSGKADKTEDTEEIHDLFGEYKNEDVEIISASSIEELMRKVEDYRFSIRSDSVQTAAERMVGQSIDFRG